MRVCVQGEVVRAAVEAGAGAGKGTKLGAEVCVGAYYPAREELAYTLQKK